MIAPALPIESDPPTDVVISDEAAALVAEFLLSCVEREDAVADAEREAETYNP